MILRIIFKFSNLYLCLWYISFRYRKTQKIEQAKLLDLRAKEHSKRIEKSVELGRKSILFEAAETRDKTALAELET